jgi:hypothetical protein
MTIELSNKTVDGFAAYKVSEMNSRKARIVLAASVFDQLLTFKTKTERGAFQDAIVIAHSKADEERAIAKGSTPSQARADASFFSNPANVKKFMKVPTRYENSDYRDRGYGATGEEMLRLIEDECMTSQSDWERDYSENTPSGQKNAQEQVVRKAKAEAEKSAKALVEAQTLVAIDPRETIADAIELLAAESEVDAVALSEAITIILKTRAVPTAK